MSKTTEILTSMSSGNEIAGSPIARVWDALRGVCDPEIPVISIVEMGMVSHVQIDGQSVVLQMTPTFSGCPALNVIRENIREAVLDAGFRDVRVDVVFDPPWSSDRISVDGRRKLKEFGLAPPGSACGGIDETKLAAAACPFCDSKDTTMESIFGPTLCRAIHYCNSCRQSFEQFKPI